MSGGLGSLLGAIAPIGGGLLGSALGEGLGSLFGAGANSILTPSILADIGGAAGGAGVGALANKNRGLGALGGGLEGLLTGPSLSNWLGIPGALGQSNVTPFLSSLFGGQGWGRGAAGAAAGAAGGGGAAQSGVGPMGGGAAPFSGQTAVPGSPAALGTNNVGAISTAGAGGGAGGGGNILQSVLGSGSGIGGSSLGLPQLLALLGGGGALASQLAQGGAANMPNAGQFNALAQQAMGNTGMANALRTGQLPPGAEQMAETGLQDAQAGIRARYAAMGLSGSTMEGQDLASAQMQSEAQKYQMAQSAANFGMQNMQLADTIYGQIANYQLDQDKQLQDALAAFASAASGGSINYGQGGSGASQNIMSQAA